jgi:hypothetical protein
MDITDTGKRILDAIKEADTVTASQLVLELESHALKLETQVMRLRQQLEELEGHPGVMNDMYFDGKMYWRGEGDDRVGPFCQRCMDGEHRAIRLKHRDETVSGYKSEWYECHNCQIRIAL